MQDSRFFSHEDSTHCTTKVGHYIATPAAN